MDVVNKIESYGSSSGRVKGQMKIYQQFNIKSKIDPLSIVDLIYDKNTSQKDLHFWLSPKNALKFAEHVMKTLVNLDTKNVAIYKKNYKKLKTARYWQIHACKKDAWHNARIIKTRNLRNQLNSKCC